MLSLLDPPQGPAGWLPGLGPKACIVVGRQCCQSRCRPYQGGHQWRYGTPSSHGGAFVHGTEGRAGAGRVIPVATVIQTLRQRQAQAGRVPMGARTGWWAGGFYPCRSIQRMLHGSGHFQKRNRSLLRADVHSCCIKPRCDLVSYPCGPHGGLPVRHGHLLEGPPTPC